MYNLEILKKEFKEYQQNMRSSQKQHHLIQKKYQKYVSQNKNPDTLLDILNKCLSRKILNITDVIHSDIDTILNYFDHQLLQLSSKKKNQILSNKLDFQEITKVLKKPIDSIDQLTRVDYYRLSTHPKYNFSFCLNHFNLINQDHVIESNPYYEHGYQSSDLSKDNKLYYLKFYDFMMIDYDKISLDEIISILENHYRDEDQVLFYIYKTYNGYHLYFMSFLCNHNDRSTCFTMKNLKCDLWYILFSYKNGFKIRLSKKLHRNEGVVQEFVQSWGNGQPDPSCLEYITILNDYMNCFNK